MSYNARTGHSKGDLVEAEGCWSQNDFFVMKITDVPPTDVDSEESSDPESVISVISVMSDE